MLAWLGIGSWQTAAIWRRSRPAPRSSREALARIVGDGQAPPDLLLSGRLGQPVAVGLLRPTIILPDRFAEDEPGRRLEAALAHEWAHIRNRDLWWIALSRILMPVLFAHPVYWWLRRRDPRRSGAAGRRGRGGRARRLCRGPAVLGPRDARSAAASSRGVAGPVGTSIATQEEDRHAARSRFPRGADVPEALGPWHPRRDGAGHPVALRPDLPAGRRRGRPARVACRPASRPTGAEQRDRIRRDGPGLRPRRQARGGGCRVPIRHVPPFQTR